MFSNNADSSATFKLQMEVKDIGSAVYTIDSNKFAKQFAFGLSSGEVHIINFDYELESPEFEPYQGNFS